MAAFPDREWDEIVGLFPATPPEALLRWADARSKISATEEAAEPLLQPEPDRVALFPIKDAEIFEFRKTIEKLRWMAQEVDLSRDAADMAAAEPADRRLVEHVLSFFVGADDLILGAIDARVGAALPTKEAAYYLAAQADQECTHSEAYGLQLQEALPPGPRRRALEGAMRTSPAVARMGDLVRFHAQARQPAADLFLAMAFIEGVMFSGFFAALHHYRASNKFPGIVALNEFICRDEGVHARFWCFLLTQRLRRRPDPQTAAAVAREIVALSDGFFVEALPAPTTGGLSAALLGEYVRYAADSVAVQAGYAPVFGATNPMPEMESLALNAGLKTNFFESNVSSYARLARPDALVFRIDDAEPEA